MGKDQIFSENLFDASPFGLPQTKGVYAICVIKFNGHTKLTNLNKYVVYIGSSKDMRKRVYNKKHIYRRLYSIFENFYVVVMYYETNDYQEIEKYLIRKYKPRFNVHYK